MLTAEGTANVKWGDGTDASEPLLWTEGLEREFGGVRAVAGVSIAMRAGHITGLIGPNGAGKSTTLAMLAGTLAPSAGRIVFAGDDISALPAYKRAQLGLIRTFQLSSEFKQMTVLENLLVAVPGNPGDSLTGSLFRRRRSRAFEREALVYAADLLERFRLAQYGDTLAGALSGGQRRLVEIMRALMAKPRMLLLDEPMAGVHPRLAIEIGEHLLRLRDEGLSIVMVEHELSIVDQLCEPVIVLAEGRVLSEGTMAELRTRQDVVDAYLIG